MCDTLSTMNGTFTISLDFELHWGGFEKWPLFRKNSMIQRKDNTAYYDQYFLNTREVIPQMLSLFEKYNVHATWAGVGLLFHENAEDLFKNVPTIKPSYVNKELSAYNYIEEVGIGANEKEDPFHYADSLINQIAAVRYQEIGSHTFGHYYCNEAGQTVEQFRADLQSAQQAAAAYGITLRSLVFPRNQFNDDYLKVCWECGFTSVRSNPDDWFWKIETRNEGLMKRLARGADAYIPGIGKKNSFSINSIKVRPDLPVCIPASRLLRPFRAKEGFLNQWKINRIKREMTFAAQHNEVYHLWWHPHNFGNFTNQNIQGLTSILNHFEYLSDKYGMQSLSMGELSNQIFTHAKASVA